MAADEEIAGHEIGGEEVGPVNPDFLPPVTDPADTDDAYGEVEYAGDDVNVDAHIPVISHRGDTDDAYGEIEYAGKDVREDAVFQSLPLANVEEFDTSIGRLGCGTPTVFITSRCNGAMTCQLDLKDITKLSWSRRLDEISTAEVEIGLSGDATQTCCACLATVEPWCHELHIWRDGDEVWVGPIQAVRYERERVTLYARDSLAWLDVRIPNEDVDFETKWTGTITNNPLSATDTVIHSAEFSQLPEIPTANNPSYVVVLDHPDPTRRETVVVISHAAGATSVTATRAQYGSVAQQHNSGSTWAAGGLAGPDSDLTDIAKYMILTGFEEDLVVGNTCEVDQLYSVLTGEVIEFYSEAFNDTAGTIFHNIADQTKLNYTVLGRTIILMGDTLSLTPLALLNDDHIMGEIEVVKDGLLQANRVWIHYEGDGGVPAMDEIPASGRYCYSLVERIMNGDGLGLETDAQDTANEYLDVAAIAPRILTIPEGSKLSADTPWTINQMVPGARVDVAITRLCLELTQSFLLTGINVEYNEGEGELIGISLSPMNTAAG